MFKMLMGREKLPRAPTEAAKKLPRGTKKPQEVPRTVQDAPRGGKRKQKSPAIESPSTLSSREKKTYLHTRPRGGAFQCRGGDREIPPLLRFL